LAWLRHLAPPGMLLRVVVARDGKTLVGVVPLVAQPTRSGRMDYRLMAAPLPRMEPLAIRGREWEVAAAAAAVLYTVKPTPDLLALESLPAASPWPEAFCRTWPSRFAPLSSQYFRQWSPVVSLGAGSFDDWLAGKSSNYRAQMRRRRRKFEESGGTVRYASLETLPGDVDIFLRLHRERWEGHGQSSIVPVEAELKEILLDSGRQLLPEGHLRLIVLEIDGDAVAAQVNVAAGGEVLWLNAGWNERYAKLSPQLLCLLEGLDDAFRRGDRRYDLGPGQQHFKLRMADGNDPIAWTILMLPTSRLPLTLARTAPMLAKRRMTGFAKRALSGEQVDRLRGVRARLAR
jgi:CelD/BcsL family acetyltransferase involved in cellulose biosynthesis